MGGYIGQDKCPCVLHSVNQLHDFVLISQVCELVYLDEPHAVGLSVCKQPVVPRREQSPWLQS